MLRWVVFFLFVSVQPAVSAGFASYYNQALTLSGRVALQGQLILNGYYDGAVDGIFGPQTIRAIKRYQREHDDPETGKLSGAQASHLRRLSRQISKKTGLVRFWDKRVKAAFMLPRQYVGKMQVKEIGTDFIATPGRRPSDLFFFVGSFVEKRGLKGLRWLYERKRKNLEAKTLHAQWLGDGFILYQQQAELLQYFAVFSDGKTSKGLGVAIDVSSGKDVVALAKFMVRMFFPFANEGLDRSQLVHDDDLTDLHVQYAAVTPEETGRKKERPKRGKPPAAAQPSEPSRPSGRPEPHRPSEPRRPPERREEEGMSFGTGFFVSDKGHIVTNAHVAGRCSTIHTARWGKARLLHLDKENDLAILRLIDRKKRPKALLLSQQQTRLGQDIVALGYPLPSILSLDADDMSVTTGVVSRLSGLGGDRRLLVISAPVQQGNSGGPLVNKNGEVIGVVTAKLDASYMLEATGDIPQNVNFAVKRHLVEKAMQRVNLAPVRRDKSRGGEADESIADLVERLKPSVAFLVCFTSPKK